jgi:hypothetical protein
MFTQESFAALFPRWRIGELFIEASDVDNVITFNRERVRIVCSINLRTTSFVSFEIQLPSQTLLLAREESERIYQDELALIYPFHIFDHRLRSVRWTSAPRAPIPKCIAMGGGSEFSMRRKT